MNVQIEQENTFRKIFNDGMNLFLGAGFSVLAKDCDSRPIPTGSELAEDLRGQFALNELDTLSLPQLCTILEATSKQVFHEYLRRRFTVHKFDDRYKCINSCNIHSIFTINIDDLLFKVFASNERNYLNDMSQRGPIFSDKSAVGYIPLHGSILNEGEPLIFSSTDIVSSFSRDPDKWYFLTRLLQKSPTLFWGCSLNDADVLKSLSPETIKGREHKPKWVVLKRNNPAEIQYFQALGFFIIIGETGQLLDYISGIDFEAPKHIITKEFSISEFFPKESIPKTGQVPVRPLLDFYMGAEPIWHDVFSGNLYRTSHFPKIVESLNSGKNTIVLGIPACGKTTLMMQVAADINFNGHKLVSADMPVQKAELILKKLNGQRALIFLDNFTDNIDSFYLLTHTPNVLVASFDRDYNFDITSHKIERTNFKILDVTELSDRDRQSVFSKIPSTIRKGFFTIPKTEQGVIPSLYEVMEENITRPKLSSRFNAVLKQLEYESYSLHDFFVMCCYVHSCRTPISFDMAYAFLRDEATGYQYVYDISDRLGALVSDYYGPLIDSEQDHFIPRSTIVSDAVMREVSETGLRRTILHFHKEVSPYRICNYNVFKKRAFDKDIMKKAFSDWEEGMDFYDSMYGRDKSPYLLQQGALYLSYKHRFNEAFSWIDRAVTETGGKVFSIRNSHAIILFRANIGAISDETKDSTLKRSMDILSECYHDDKRKIYHAHVFAWQALQYWDVYGSDAAKEYLITAEEWLKSEAKRSPWSHRVRELLRKVSQKLRQIQP